MKTLQTNNLTLETATNLICEITTKLALSNLNFTVTHNDAINRFTIVSVKHTDACASLYSNFEVLFATGRKYAQMVINYE